MTAGPGTYQLTRELIASDTIRKAFFDQMGLRPLSEAELEASLDTVIPRASTGQGIWVFAYGSLIWNPCLRFEESRVAILYGRRRALALRSRFGRGTEANPGLLFSLIPGGSCGGLALRIAPELCRAELRLLWRREMIAGSYQPRVFRVRTAQGPVPAIAFDANRSHANYNPSMPLDDEVRMVSAAQGIAGTNVDYVLRTRDALRAHGMRDRRLEALCDRLPSGAGQTPAQSSPADMAAAALAPAESAPAIDPDAY